MKCDSDHARHSAIVLLYAAYDSGIDRSYFACYGIRPKSLNNTSPECCTIIALYNYHRSKALVYDVYARVLLARNLS